MKLLVLGLFILISSCEKDMKQYNMKGVEYRKGIYVVDLVSDNDCSLPICSDRRVKRLVADGVKGIIYNDSTLQIGLTMDSVIKLRTCNKIDSLLINKFGAEIPFVKISGDIYDACGFIDYGIDYEFPVEEYYFIKNYKIEKL